MAVCAYCRAAFDDAGDIFDHTCPACRRAQENRRHQEELAQTQNEESARQSEASERANERLLEELRSAADEREMRDAEMLADFDARQARDAERHEEALARQEDLARNRWKYEAEARLKEAFIAYRSRRPEAALQLLDDSLRLNPNDLDAYKLAAWLKHERGDKPGWKAALREQIRMLQHAPNAVDLRRLLSETKTLDTERSDVLAIVCSNIERAGELLDSMDTADEQETAAVVLDKLESGGIGSANSLAFTVPFGLELEKRAGTGRRWQARLDAILKEDNDARIVALLPRIRSWQSVSAPVKSLIIRSVVKVVGSRSSRLTLEHWPLLVVAIECALSAQEDIEPEMVLVRRMIAEEVFDNRHSLLGRVGALMKLPLPTKSKNDLARAVEDVYRRRTINIGDLLAAVPKGISRAEYLRQANDGKLLDDITTPGTFFFWIVLMSLLVCVVLEMTLGDESAGFRGWQVALASVAISIGTLPAALIVRSFSWRGIVKARVRRMNWLNEANHLNWMLGVTEDEAARFVGKSPFTGDHLIRDLAIVALFWGAMVWVYYLIDTGEIGQGNALPKPAFVPGPAKSTAPTTLAYKAVPPKETILPGGMALDAQQNCHVWKPALQPRETVRWTGDCFDLKAAGRGKAEWFVNGQPTLTYEGTFANGRIYGDGLMRAAGGDRYEGEYRDGMRDGKGTYLAATGERYEGEWKRNVREGHGVLILADRSRYEGEFKDGKPLGPVVRPR